MKENRTFSPSIQAYQDSQLQFPHDFPKYLYGHKENMITFRLWWQITGQRPNPAMKELTR